MLILRPDQKAVITDVRAKYRGGAMRPLLVAPTGFGKTVVFSYIAHSMSNKGHRILILVHRAELIDQVCKTLDSFGVQYSVIAKGTKYVNLTRLVYVASVQTLVRRTSLDIKPDLIIVDEAHHSVAGSWFTILDRYKTTRVLGVTATPARLDGSGLGAVYDSMVLGPSVQWLMDNGHLSRARYFAPTSLDMAGAHMRGGDFTREDVAEQMDQKPQITGDAIKYYKRCADGQRAIVFSYSLAHAHIVAQRFREAGYAFSVIDGTLSDVDRRRMVSQFSDGTLQGLVSCEIVSEGFDLPAVTACILLRPTASLGLHLQQIGRSLRVAPGKDAAIILDHVGNLVRHGYAETPREWSLEAKKKKTRETVPIKTCPECYLCVPPNTIVCPSCGHEFHAENSREYDEVTGELEEILPEVIRARKIEQAKANSYNDLVILGMSRGYKNPRGWAWHVMQSRDKKKEYV